MAERETFLQGQRRKLAEQRGNRITPILDELIGTENPDDLAVEILNVLSEGGKVPQSGNYCQNCLGTCSR